jgi:hypothetical protein
MRFCAKFLGCDRAWSRRPAADADVRLFYSFATRGCAAQDHGYFLSSLLLTALEALE